MICGLDSTHHRFMSALDCSGVCVVHTRARGPVRSCAQSAYRVVRTRPRCGNHSLSRRGSRTSLHSMEWSCTPESWVPVARSSASKLECPSVRIVRLMM